MKVRTLLLSTALATVVSLPAVAADCNSELEALKASATEGDTKFWEMASATQREYRQLRQAATIFQENGQEEACMQVVDGMEQMLDAHRADYTEADYAAWSEQEIERIKSASPVSTYAKSIHVDDVVGSELRNMNNEKLGTIDKVVLEPGRSTRINYVVVTHDGFLGMGEEQSAVPWDHLKVTTDEGDKVYVVDASKESFESAPRFQRDSRQELDDPNWQKENDDYYKNTLNSTTTN